MRQARGREPFLPKIRWHNSRRPFAKIVLVEQAKVACASWGYDIMRTKNPYPPNFIKQLREARDWTLRDLEQKIGWSNQTLSNLELSKADLTWTKILKLATVFECHPLDITAGPDAALEARTEEERWLLKTYRSLEDASRRKFRHLVENFRKEEDAGSKQ